MPRFAVGIDLGTTNCALAYIAIGKGTGQPTVETLAIEQLVELGELGNPTLLPSAVYLPDEQEIAPSQLALPWDEHPSRLVGFAALRQGTRIPGRLVTSAKSWLCHAGVDRRAAILPWGSEETSNQISPVEASAALLKHLVDAWNTRFAKDRHDNRLESQSLVLTVPASFDEVARELTVESAKAAGLEHITLLEEPQAAFYNWLHAHAHAEIPLPVGTVCLVIDCGGGTTDFSLIGITEHLGKADVRRLAVGEHLLLGGDNMDIALARHVEQQISPARRLDSSQWGNLVMHCRRAKEAMLSPDPPATLTITVPGRGRSVVGGSLQHVLALDDARRIVVEGFFPQVRRDERPASSKSLGLQEFGLPFVADAAVTRHLAEFLSQHAPVIRQIARTDVISAVLFNGGVFNALTLRERILSVLGDWYGADWRPTVLDSDSMDLAVARGAAHHAWARQTGRRRIQSSIGRSYYIEVAGRDPGDDARRTVLCIVPQSLQELEEVSIEEPPLLLRIGEPVRFPLYTSTVRPQDAAGMLLSIEPGQLAPLPALTTVLRGGRRAGAKHIRVRLQARLTEIGTLELFAAALDGQNRWKLQFQTRLAPTTAEVAEPPITPIDDVWSSDLLEGAQNVLREAFLGAQREALIGVSASLEEALKLSKEKWPTGVLRALWETLQGLADRRQVSVEHEARWLNLAGYLLRPGWGDPLDPHRVEQLWKLTHQGVLATAADRVWIEYWIVCRRIAGGLDAARQHQLGKRLRSYVLAGGPGGRKPPRRAGPQELSEIWRAVASLEWMPVPAKVDLGQILFKQLRKRPIPPHAFWSILRIGARVLVHGPANLVVGRETCERWIDELLALSLDDARNQVERDFALSQLARRSGDRARDIDDDVRDRVLQHLQANEAPEAWIDGVNNFATLESAEASRVLGDSVPPGLRIADADGFNDPSSTLE